MEKQRIMIKGTNLVSFYTYFKKKKIEIWIKIWYFLYAISFERKSEYD